MARQHSFRDAALALSLLTVVPTGVRWPGNERVAAAGWFPVVGLALGGVVAGTVSLVELPATQPLLTAALVVTFLALATRFLHWDGLADVADAWWGGATPQRRLEIMSDSATGAFGATALVLVGALQVTAVAAILQAGTPAVLVIAPALARLAATFAAWLGKPARPEGLGRSVMGPPDAVSALATLCAIVGCFWVGWTALAAGGAVFVGLGVVLALVVPHLFSVRMGGVTGDVMGASVLVVETVLFVLAAVVLGG